MISNLSCFHLRSLTLARLTKKNWRKEFSMKIDTIVGQAKIYCCCHSTPFMPGARFYNFHGFITRINISSRKCLKSSLGVSESDWERKQKKLENCLMLTSSVESQVSLGSSLCNFQLRTRERSRRCPFFLSLFNLSSSIFLSLDWI